MYADHVTCCPLMSHGKYANVTDRLTDKQTPEHYTYITLSATDAASITTR